MTRDKTNLVVRRVFVDAQDATGIDGLRERARWYSEYMRGRGYRTRTYRRDLRVEGDSIATVIVVVRQRVLIDDAIS